MLPSETLHEIYKEMDSEPRFRHFYYAALTPLQIEFVSQVPVKVKNLIRLMKFWKKTGFEVSIFGAFCLFCISNSHLHKYGENCDNQDFFTFILTKQWYRN